MVVPKTTHGKRCLLAVDDGEIDRDRLVEAARIAGIHDSLIARRGEYYNLVRNQLGLGGCFVT